MELDVMEAAAETESETLETIEALSAETETVEAATTKGPEVAADMGPQMSAPQPDGHGSLASDLKGLNAAHASAVAVESAAPYSRVRQIASYQKTMFTAETLRVQAAEKAADVDALIAGYEGMTVAGVEAALAEAEADLRAATEAGDTGSVEAAGALLVKLETALSEAEAFEAALEVARVAADTARLQAEEAELAQNTLLRQLTRGEDLSPEALAYFHALLAGTNIADSEA